MPYLRVNRPRTTLNSIMALRTIYFDESGFTGYNLLDRDQPIFAVSSADIEGHRAEQILKESFPGYRAAEFKFRKIWGSNNRRGLLNFAKHLSALEDHVFVYVVDKRFAVLTKIVDFLIEPYITDAGFDFYDDGFCWKYCNYIYFGLTHFAPPELLDAIIRRYQIFSRDPTPEALRDLQTHLRLMASSVDERIKVFLEQMELGARLFNNYHNLQQFRGSDELQMTSMVAIVARWRQLYPDDFSVVHDNSSNFLRSKELWRRITNNKVPKQLHRLGDGSFVEFPLRVISTCASDSKKSRSIQFCDLLAGLAARHFRSDTDEAEREFIDDIIGAGLKDINYNGIRPSEIFPDQIPPKKLSGPDIVDQMTQIIFGPHNESTIT
jgi:hypothetical protein